jgi:hypothetical protein
MLSGGSGGGTTNYVEITGGSGGGKANYITITGGTNSTASTSTITFTGTGTETVTGVDKLSCAGVREGNAPPLRSLTQIREALLHGMDAALLHLGDSPATDTDEETDEEEEEDMGSPLTETEKTAIVGRVVSKLETYTRFMRATANQDRGQGVPGIIGYEIPCIAPLGLSIVADMLAMLEQDRDQPSAFVTSCLDFADVRKLEGSSHIQWKGTRAWLYGVEVVRSPDVPAGFFVAVGREKMVISHITR